VLILSRSKPPLLSGPHFDLAALGARALANVFQDSLVERIAAHPQGELLMRVCGRDLQIPRMLWRLRGWPAPHSMGPLLAESNRDGAGGGSGDLLELVLQAVLGELSRDALNVLQTLALFTYLVHQEVLSHLTELDGKRLGQALAELQWMGLVDAFGGERYFALQLRLQGLVARRLLTPEGYARLRPMLLRTYGSYPVSAQSRIEFGTGSGAALPYSLWAWGEPAPGAHDLAQTRTCHRLGLERTNLAELAVILAEEEDWEALARFAAAATFLRGVPGMSDLTTLLHRLVLAAGRAEQDPVLQATALMGLATPLLEDGRAAEAQPLLERALDLLGQSPGWEELAQAYLLLSRCYVALEQQEAAINMLHAAEELARQLGNPERLAEAAEALAAIWRTRDEGAEQSDKYLEQTIRRLEQGGHLFQAAKLKLLLGERHAEAERFEAARALLEAALRAFRDGGREAETHQTLLRMAELHLAEQLPDEALETFMQAKAATERRGDALLEDRVLTRICRLFEQQERYEEALQGYLLLRKIREARGDREGLMKVLDLIGGLYFQLGEQANSTRFYEESLQLKETIPQS
jgi:tetratricopeptide (TPR) repeat protein